MNFFLRALNKISELFFRFLLKSFIFLLDKIALWRKKFRYRKITKLVKALGGEVTFKSNEYVGGVNVGVVLPVDRFEEIEKNPKDLKILIKILNEKQKIQQKTNEKFRVRKN